MRIVKIACVLVCLISLARFVAIIYGIRSSQTGSMVTKHSILAMIWSLLIALVGAVEFYGIHTKALFAWKLGWVILAVVSMQSLILAGSSAIKVPEADYPWVAFAAVMVVFSLVALYLEFLVEASERLFHSTVADEPKQEKEGIGGSV